MRKAEIFYQEVLAGILIETNEGEYNFEYEAEYIEHYPNQFITFSMPVVKGKYKDNRLFPFLRG